MRRSWRICLLAGAASASLSFGGCASQRAFRGQMLLVPGQPVVVVRTWARAETEGLVVGGDVKRAEGQRGRVRGHLHLVGRDSEGRIVASTDAPWGDFIARRFHLAYFRALLRTDRATSIASVTVVGVSDPAP
jgi:hypothetical protein